MLFIIIFYPLVYYCFVLNIIMSGMKEVPQGRSNEL